MITTDIVVALRPFQVLLTCASLVFTGVDQQFRGDSTRLVVILAVGGPAAILSLAVAVQTVWSFLSRGGYRHKTRTLRWLVDFFIFILLGGLIIAHLFLESEYPKGKTPSIPWTLLWRIADISASALFFVTFVALATEDVRMRNAVPIPVIVTPGGSTLDSDQQSEMSNAVESFTSTWGSISKPVILRDTEKHLGAGTEGIVIEEPKSRWSEYSND